MKVTWSGCFLSGWSSDPSGGQGHVTSTEAAVCWSSLAPFTCCRCETISFCWKRCKTSLVQLTVTGSDITSPHPTIIRVFMPLRLFHVRVFLTFSLTSEKLCCSSSSTMKSSPEKTFCKYCCDFSLFEVIKIPSLKNVSCEVMMM